MAAALLLAAGVGCGPRDEARLHLRVAALRQPATSLVYVAEAAGCVERERLTLEVKDFDLGRDAVATLGRDSDVAVGYETVVVRTAATHPERQLRVIGTLHHSKRNTRMLATASSGISSFADLRGKRVGAAGGTNADFFIGLVLRFGGVDQETVDVVNLSPREARDALLARTVDAAVLSDPFATEVERELGGAARVLESQIYDEYSLLTVPAELVQREAPALRALLRALICAERFANANPEQVMAELRRKFPGVAEQSLREQRARVTWVVGLDNLLLNVLRRESACCSCLRRAPRGE